MDYLGKVEMLTNRDVNKCVHNREKYAFYANGTFLASSISAHETNTSHVAFIFLLSIYIIRPVLFVIIYLASLAC